MLSAVNQAIHFNLNTCQQTTCNAQDQVNEAVRQKDVYFEYSMQTTQNDASIDRLASERREFLVPPIHDLYSQPPLWCRASRPRGWVHLGELISGKIGEAWDSRSETADNLVAACIFEFTIESEITEFQERMTDVKNRWLAGAGLGRRCMRVCVQK